MDNDVNYLISFLGIIVQRNGGMLEIKNLSQDAGKSILISFEINKQEDKVTIIAIDKPTGSPVVPILGVN